VKQTLRSEQRIKDAKTKCSRSSIFNPGYAKYEYKLTSHSFRRQIKALGVDFATVGPGTRTRQTMKIITAGATRPERAKVVVEIFSLVTKG